MPSLRRSARPVVALLTATWLWGCATPAPQRLERVQVGMDKTEVLDVAGNPRWSRRHGGGDQWTYSYYIGEKHFVRALRFESGHVVQIFPAQEVKTAGDVEPEDVVIKDYEQLVHEAGKASDKKASEKGNFQEK